MKIFFSIPYHATSCMTNVFINIFFPNWQISTYIVLQLKNIILKYKYNIYYYYLNNHLSKNFITIIYRSNINWIMNTTQRMTKLDSIVDAPARRHLNISYLKQRKYQYKRQRKNNINIKIPKRNMLTREIFFKLIIILHRCTGIQRYRHAESDLWEFNQQLFIGQKITKYKWSWKTISFIQ